jgi:hypothetical protein
MIISDLQHLEIVSEETQIQGQGGGYYYQNDAVATGDSSAIAEGPNTFTGTNVETNTYTRPGLSASNTKGKSYSSTRW